MANPWISRLVSLSGLDVERDRIESCFQEQFAPSSHDPSGRRKSGLTRNGTPVEFGLTFDRGVATGFKYTIDLFANEAAANLVDRVRHLASTVTDSTTSINALERSMHALATSSPGRLAGVYWSVGYVRGAPPRARLHIVGGNAALDRDTLENLDPAILPRQRLMSVLAAADSLHKTAIDIVCLGPASDGSLRCKLYVLTDPYIDLRTVTRLALSLRLSTGHALSLLRWYASFVGHHEGRLGAFGLGIDASGRSGGHGVEAYAYLGDTQMPVLRRRIDQHVPGMTSVWSVLDRQEADGSRLELSGCGVETASFGRFGRMTAYVYPASTTA